MPRLATIALGTLLLALGLALASPAAASIIFHSNFDDVLADWAPGTPAPVVLQGPGVARVGHKQGVTPFGRLDSIGLVGLSPSITIEELTFEVQLADTGDNGAQLWIAFFDDTTFLAGAQVMDMAAGGPLFHQVGGSGLTAPVGTDGFGLVLLATSSTLDPTVFDAVTVTAPEPGLLAPTALFLAGMLRARRRRAG